MSFEILSAYVTKHLYNWQDHWEAFCLCGHCKRATIFQLSGSDYNYRVVTNGPGGLVGVKGSVNDYVRIERFISINDEVTTPPPEYLSEDVLAPFKEGAKCLSVGCYNAAGTMFRLCVDIASRNKLPAGSDNGLNYKTRRDLGLRLPWLFDNRLLPEDLRELSTCIKEDGNDGAHQGSLSKEDALDLLDFTVALLTRIYTEPEKLRLAKERREARRSA
jgi:hypothetical protein